MTEKKKFKLSITILIIIAIILIDQVSKILVINFVKQDVGIITLSQKSEEIKIADVIISILSDCVVFTVIIKFLKEQSKYMSTKVKMCIRDSTDGIPYQSIIKGDAKCYSISAASIIAKVTRDRIMRQWDEIYPQYGFAKHKGYGTAEHIKALKEYGPCPLHRESFIKHFV